MDWVIGLITGLGIISGILTLIKRDKKMGIIQLILTIIVPISISLWYKLLLLIECWNLG